jgi:hypothetical protein
MFCKSEWQTMSLVIDDIYPVVDTLTIYSLNKKMSAEIYTLCDKCKSWSEAKIRKGKLCDLQTKEPQN